ncbi:hypothetical protein SAMN04515648_3853 [Phyllobacterium sp. CL33Tsu]|nr:hypothetical protein SAMN04515648_3853 [Phyllobacterium sp. CL33Tsu]
MIGGACWPIAITGCNDLGIKPPCDYFRSTEDHPNSWKPLKFWRPGTALLVRLQPCPVRNVPGIVPLGSETIHVDV